MWSFTSVYIKVYSFRCDIDLYKVLALKKVSVLFVSLEEIVSASILVLSLIFETQMQGFWVLFASSVSYCHSESCSQVKLKNCQSHWDESLYLDENMNAQRIVMDMSFLSVKLVNLEYMLINRYLFYLKKSLVLFVMKAGNTMSSRCSRMNVCSFISLLQHWTFRRICAEFWLLLRLFRIMWTTKISPVIYCWGKAFIHYRLNPIAGQ